MRVHFDWVYPHLWEPTGIRADADFIDKVRKR